MAKDNDGDLGKAAGASWREAPPEGGQASTRSDSVKRRAKAAAVHVRENLAGT